MWALRYWAPRYWAPRYWTSAAPAAGTQAVADTLGLTEATQRLVGRRIAETLVLTEGLTRHSVRLATVGDTVALSESLRRAIAHGVADVLTLTEAPGIQRPYHLAEPLLLSETLGTLLIPFAPFAIIAFSGDRLRVPDWAREQLRVPEWAEERLRASQ